MNQAVLDQLTSAVVDIFAEQPLEPFDASSVEVIAAPAPDRRPAPAPQPMPVHFDLARDTLALATWEDAEWQ